MTSLTRKQRIFVKEYLVDSNATRSAIAAGYSKASATVIGSRLLTNVKVRGEIDKQTGKRCEKLEITADYVLEGIRSIVARCEKTGQFSTALKGYELLGKHLKLFTDKTELTGEGGSAVRIILHGGKSDDEQREPRLLSTANLQ
jgi:phage terminase small subunit